MKMKKIDIGSKLNLNIQHLYSVQGSTSVFNNPDHHLTWYSMTSQRHQVPRVPGVGKSEPIVSSGIQLLSEFPPNLSN